MEIRPSLKGMQTTWDEAGRLLFARRVEAIQWAHARAAVTGTRQRVRNLRATTVPGYVWHVSVVPSAPVQLEEQLWQRPDRVPLCSCPTCVPVPATELVTVDVCS